MWRVRTVLSGWTGGPGLQTFYFNGPAASYTPTDVSAVLTRVRTFWNTIASYIPVGISAQVQGTIDTLDPEDGQITTQDAVTQPSVVNGSATNPSLPPQCMLLLKLGTSSFDRGRRIVGRSFIGPVTRYTAEAMVPLPGTITAIASTGTTLMGSPGQYSLAVWHRPLYTGVKPNKVLVQPGSVATVTTCTCSPKYATLNSRRD